MSFRWAPANPSVSNTLNLDVNFELVGRWAAIRVFDPNTYSADYNELRKTAGGKNIFASEVYFKKVWIEPIGRGAEEGAPYGEWAGRNWNCSIPLIASTESNPRGVLLKPNDEVIVPNYWESAAPTTLTGLEIETQHKLSMAHVYHLGSLLGYWVVQFTQTAEK